MKYMLVLALALAPAMAFADETSVEQLFMDAHPVHQMQCSDNSQTRYPSWDPAICTWSDWKSDKQGTLHVTYDMHKNPTYVEYKCTAWTEYKVVRTGGYVYEDGGMTYDKDLEVKERSVKSQKTVMAHPGDEVGMDEVRALISSPGC